MGTQSYEPSFSPTVAMVYFSPTGTTERVIENIARGLNGSLNYRFNITQEAGRKEYKDFTSETKHDVDYWIFGAPVYGGELPPIVVETLAESPSNNQKAISCVVYGNNEIGRALKQLTQILDEYGFSILGAAAFIGEHSFSNMFNIAPGRPDQQDLNKAEAFGKSVLSKGSSSSTVSYDSIDDKMSFSTKVLPKKGPNPIVDHSKCTKCLTCVEHCPMGIIDAETIEYISAEAKELCLGCMSCVKRCPENARSFEIPFPMDKILDKVFTEAKSTRHEPLILL